MRWIENRQVRDSLYTKDTMVWNVPLLMQDIRPGLDFLLLVTVGVLYCISPTQLENCRKSRKTPWTVSEFSANC